jgi:hypothetical protein
VIKFSQQDAESQISDIIPRGLRRDIARLTGVYESVIYGMLNADDERKSYQYGTLQIQAALDELDPEVGDRHWQKMCKMREVSKGAKTELSLDLHSAKLSTEVAELFASRFKNEALYSQLSEAMDVQRVINDLVNGIIEEINKDKARAGSPHLRFNANSQPANFS